MVAHYYHRKTNWKCLLGQFVVSRCGFWHILGFSVLSITLADLIANTCLVARLQKVMVCYSCLVDLNPFCLFRVTRVAAL